ncbi:MAG TPA: LysE family transporter, partial [Candidatus Hydrogenedentes bacterium]|nr:LysE family transporter [Candidatus Hydrogenedentota bacterium]
LAYESFRTGALDPDAECAKPQSLSKGVIVNALSPHPYLFWLTVGAPIVVKAWADRPIAAGGFVAGFYGFLVGSKVLIAVLVGNSRRFLTGRAYVCLMRALGALLLLFSVLLFRNALALLGVLIPHV